MGLLDKLTLQGGSPLSIANGGQVATNPLATNQSKLHIYSLDGTGAQLINSQYQQYVDGVVNPLPQPTQLERNNISKYTDNLPQ